MKNVSFWGPYGVLGDSLVLNECKETLTYDLVTFILHDFAKFDKFT